MKISGTNLWDNIRAKVMLTALNAPGVEPVPLDATPNTPMDEAASTLGLRCQPTAFGRTRRDEYEARIAAKRWRELWPKVEFLE